MDRSDSTIFPEKTIRRFWEKVDRSGGPEDCWPWTGSRLPTGYGRLSALGKHSYSHRIAFEIEHGRIPAGEGHHGWCVCHSCDNPSCCNPSHLFLGTIYDNVADRDAKGRTARGDRSGIRRHPERYAAFFTYSRSPEQGTGLRNGMHTHPEMRPRGERNGRARLKEQDVLGILDALGNGESKASIARRYGIGGSQVGRIARGERWSDLQSRRLQTQIVMPEDGDQ